MMDLDSIDALLARDPALWWWLDDDNPLTETEDDE